MSDPTTPDLTGPSDPFHDPSTTLEGRSPDGPDGSVVDPVAAREMRHLIASLAAAAAPGSTTRTRTVDEVEARLPSVVPTQHRARLAQALVDPGPNLVDPFHEVEDAASRLAREALARRYRYDQWRGSVPDIYFDAKLADLTDATRAGYDSWIAGRAPILMLRGIPGSGKTHSAWGIGEELCRPAEELPEGGYGMVVVFQRTSSLLTAMRGRADADPAVRDRAHQVTRAAYECQVLLLDDLGMEQLTAYAVEQLNDLIEDRITNNRPMLITTNNTDDGLATRLGPRIASRLAQRVTVDMDHVDLRLDGGNG